MSLFRFILTCGTSAIVFKVMHDGKELFTAVGRGNALDFANICSCRNSTVIRWEIDYSSLYVTIWV